MNKPFVITIGAIVVVIVVAALLIYTPTHTIEVSTYYDPELTPEEDRERAQELGFRPGNPAIRGEPYILAALEPRPPHSGGDVAECFEMEPGSVVDLSGNLRTFCVPLDHRGTSFRIPTGEEVTLGRISIGGPVIHISRGQPETEECFYSWDRSKPLPDAWNPDILVEGDLELELPYGIRCRD